MIFNHWLSRSCWFLVLIVALVVVFTRAEFESSVLKLLPKYQSVQTQANMDRAAERINEQLILMASSKDRQMLVETFSQQLANISNEPIFSRVEYQIESDHLSEIYTTLSPFRFNLMSQADRESWIKARPPEFFVQQAKEGLYGVQTINQHQLITDPLFLFQRLMFSLADFNVMALDQDAQYLMREVDGTHHMVAFITLSESAFQPSYQKAVIQQVDAIRSKLADQNITLNSFGAVQYAHQAFQDAKDEISTVGLGSLLGIIVLVLGVFKSIRPLILSITSIGLGLVVALAATLLIFGEIHVFAVVFGATIAGVSIDYCFHYLTEATFASNETTDSTDDEASGENKDSSTVSHIIPALFIGFVSSAIVYLGFVVTGYAVLAQISVFSVVGLLAVLLTVLTVFPLFLNHKKSAPGKFINKLTEQLLDNPLQKLFHKPLVSTLLVVGLMVLAFYKITPNDDVRALQQLSPELKQQEQQIRTALDWQPSDHFILFNADSWTGLLNQEANMLKHLRSQGHELVGVSDFIAPPATQRENHQIQQQLASSAAVKNYLAEFGIPDWQAETFKVLSAETVMNTALGTVFESRFLGQVNDQLALVLPILKAQSETLSETIKLPADSDAVLIQQANDTSKLFQQFRLKSTWVLLLAVGFLWLALAVFKYNWLRSLHLVSLPLLGGFLALTLAWALGFHISLFSVLSVLLILGMGLDYVVFLSEAKKPRWVMLAMLLSCCTTVLAFGLLAFSQVAVLKSFGFMVSIGMVWVLLTAPAVRVWSQHINRS